jgi:hypothetical protein
MTRYPDLPDPASTLLAYGGALAAASDQLAPGSWLGRYQIVRPLGRGGMGCVYEAVHRALGRRVAIKTLLPALAASPESRARFLREGQAAARIRHPHIVDVTDVVADGATNYLVMEYLEGEDLGACIARAGALSLRETADLLLPVMAAVAAAHEGGVIHRDLKPENIFVIRTSHGAACPKVVDFGISKVLGEPGALALTATSTAFGTVYYLPPEQLRGAREADARSDQYALGAVLYECLTGCRAFDGDGIYDVLKNVAEGNYMPVGTRRPDLPEVVAAAIARALSVDPAGRFPAVRALGAVLLGFASPAVKAQWAGLCGHANPAPPPPPAPPADTRAPSGTLILATGVHVVAANHFDQPPVLGEAAVAIAPARSWTPRLVLVGIALAAAVVAVIAVMSARPAQVHAPQVRASPFSGRAERQAPARGAAAAKSPASVPIAPPAHPIPDTLVAKIIPSLPPPKPLRHKRRVSVHVSRPRTSAPIID